MRSKLFLRGNFTFLKKIESKQATHSEKEVIKRKKSNFLETQKDLIIIKENIKITELMFESRNSFFESKNENDKKENLW